MRKVVVMEHLSLDGVIQGPGAAAEDTSGGFDRGGWIAPYGDEALGGLLGVLMARPFDLLLGRITYDIWAGYWPPQQPGWPQANEAIKYVASRTLGSGPWSTTVVLGDVATEVGALRREAGRDLHVWGSSKLVQTLVAHDLVDELFLMVYPVVLGQGKRLFASTQLRDFWPVKTVVTGRGVVVTHYERARPSEEGRD